MNSMNKNVQPTPSSCSIYNQHYTFGLERVSRRRNSISSSDFLNLFYGIPCMALNQQDIVSLAPVDISPFHCLNKSVRKLSLCLMQEDCQCYFMCSFFCFLAFSAVVHRNDFILLIFFALFSHVWPNPTDFSVIYSDSIIRIQLRLLQALADSTQCPGEKFTDCWLSETEILSYVFLRVVFFLLQRVKTSHSMFVSPFLLSQHILNDRILEAAFIINSLECERTSEVFHQYFPLHFILHSSRSL